MAEFGTIKTYRRGGYLALIALSVAAWLISYTHHLTTTYNDAMSHLDISRLVVDNLQPGIAQLGSVWLPLNHLLSLPLIWNNWAWHSGFAGSFVSMIAYVLGSVGIFKITRELVTSKSAAVLAAAAFALNPNLLYLQSTPLTESLYVALFIASCLALIRFSKYRDYKYLVLAAIFTALQLVTRYDGWFMFVLETAVLIASEIWVHRQSIKKLTGTLVLFLTPSICAIGLWFLWNYLIFGNALYSFNGPYSAHAQQATIEASSGLITKGSLLMSTKAFGFDVIATVGVGVLIVSTIGWIRYLFTKSATSAKLRLLWTVLLSGSVLFNIIALFAGFSILNLPALHWNPTHTLAGEYFNVRYGVTALPLIAIGFGLIAHKFRGYILGLLGLLLVLQAGILVHNKLITVQDGTVGSSAFVNHDIASELHKDVGRKDKVIMSSSSFNGVMFESQLNLNQFIHEGVSSQWKGAIANPVAHAQWVVMANGNVGDPVYGSLVGKEKSAFLRSYKLVYTGAHANLYERLKPFDQFVTAKHNTLNMGGQATRFVGVNDYDLVYQTNASIDSSFAHLKQSGVNTVRFWMFGDGFAGGYQPQAGQINNHTLQKTDYILSVARKYQIHVIPTLVNNFPDYGGVDQYLRWTGIDPSQHDKFYTNQATIQLYENYLNHVLSHANSITGITYKNDPTILAWDLMNEPRAANASVIASWTNTVSQYIKQLDANHLTTIGLDKPTSEAGLSAICGIRTIDFCTVHIYPQEAGIDSYQTAATATTALQSFKATANLLHKPIMVTEVGTDKATLPYGQNPLTVLKLTTQTIDTLQYSGWTIWNWSTKPDTSFGFSPDGAANYNDASLKLLVSSAANK